MSFNIYQLDELDIFDENALWNYRDSLVHLFLQSPDGQAYSGFWVDNLLYYGYAHVGATPPHMTVEHIDEVVTKLFPANISLAAPEDADGAIPELVAFWHYLRFEYNLQQADAISAFLADLAPKFRGIMTDPSRFDVAQPAPVVDQAAGYETVEEEDAAEIEDEYDDDDDLTSEGLSEEAFFSMAGGKRTHEQNARMKKKRKAAKAARKTGRRK
jgi:hypothetical protein